MAGRRALSHPATGRFIGPVPQPMPPGTMPGPMPGMPGAMPQPMPIMPPGVGALAPHGHAMAHVKGK